MFQFSNLKICFLAGTLGQGGAERQLFYILRALTREGTQVRVLCLVENEYWHHHIRALGVPVVWVGQPKLRMLRLVQILKELRSFRPDVLQSQHFYTNIYTSAASRLQRVQDIGAMRNDGESEVRANGRLAGWVDLHGPRLMAANSHKALEFAAQHGVPQSRLFFLPNVVDTEVLHPKKSARSETIQILLVGRLVQQKRVDRFLRVLARVRRTSGRKIKGVIVGRGPLREELEKQAKSLGLFPDGVEFQGAVTDMASVYAAADICALTSDYEGTPNVVLEAMAAGLPVVATQVGGVAHLVCNGKNGFVVEANDEDGLMCALSRLVEDESMGTQMGQCARAFVEQNHSLQRLPEILEQLYARVKQRDQLPHRVSTRGLQPDADASAQ